MISCLGHSLSPSRGAPCSDDAGAATDLWDIPLASAPGADTFLFFLTSCSWNPDHAFLPSFVSRQTFHPEKAVQRQGWQTACRVFMRLRARYRNVHIPHPRRAYCTGRCACRGHATDTPGCQTHCRLGVWGQYPALCHICSPESRLELIDETSASFRRHSSSAGDPPIVCEWALCAPQPPPLFRLVLCGCVADQDARGTFDVGHPAWPPSIQVPTTNCACGLPLRSAVMIL